MRAVVLLLRSIALIAPALNVAANAADLPGREPAPVVVPVVYSGEQSEFRVLQLAPAPPPNSVSIFGGQFTTGNMGQSLNPFGDTHENNSIVGMTYQRDFYRLPYGFILGGELGGAGRFGETSSGEFWGGANIRHSGIILFNTVRIATGFTFGFSAITNPIGIEAERAIRCCVSRNPHFLGYLGPELAIASPQMPNLELYYRLQHRSGAKGTFGHMGEGANANVVGVRHHFE